MKTRTKLAIALCVALVLAAAAFFLQREMKAREADRRADERFHLAQDFAEVGQCFFGGQPLPEEITFRKLMNISSRLGGTGSRWPLDCRERIDRFRTRVETAHYLDRQAADRLSSALFKLDQYLAEGGIQMVTLAEHLTGVWALAAASGIAAGTPETAGPPIPRELEANAVKLPLEGIIPLEGGPSWQFIAWDKARSLQCGGDTKLVCNRIDLGSTSPAAARKVRARGSWSSPRFILLELDDGGIFLLADGKLEALPFKGQTVVSAHVTATGEVWLVTREKTLTLWQRAIGEAATSVDLKDALAKVDPSVSRDVGKALLLGPSLLVATSSRAIHRYRVAPKGVLESGTKLDLEVPGVGWEIEIRTCRAGLHDVVLLPDTISFAMPAGLVTLPEHGDRCSASGAVWTASKSCTPAGCLDRPEAAFDSAGERRLSPHDTERDLVGTGHTIAWLAGMGGGVLVRGNAGDIATTVVLADGDAAAAYDADIVDLLSGRGPSVRLGVFGGPTGGIVLYRNGGGPQLGVAVSAGGEVTPLSIEGL